MAYIDEHSCICLRQNRGYTAPKPISSTKQRAHLTAAPSGRHESLHQCTTYRLKLIAVLRELVTISLAHTFSWNYYARLHNRDTIHFDRLNDANSAASPDLMFWFLVFPSLHFSCHMSDLILIERLQQAATKMVAGLNTMDYETRLVVLDLFPLEYRRPEGDLVLTYTLFEQGLTQTVVHIPPGTRFKTVLDTYLFESSHWQAYCPHAENLKGSATPFFTCLSDGRHPLSDKDKTDPGNLSESLNLVYQSVNL
ncbi:pol-related protein [Clonorchis sinensis]|uniref:Pol-related protein n=1 Tax=Clonorchis sinensis TaxID=79923 RepID=G7YBX7_CLOSI|nr:pol-related protein [Clonorchis sinensis]